MSIRRPGIAAQYFDGRSARPVAVSLHVDGDHLVIDATDGDLPVALRVPTRDVLWPERQRHGQRVAHLPQGASIVCADAPGWDAWRHAAGGHDSIVVRMQQSWRGTLAAAVALMVVLVAAYVWGVPLAAKAIVQRIPPTIDEQLGERALQSLRQRWLMPSTLPLDAQQRLRRRFAEVADVAYGSLPPPAYRLAFHASHLGPNALAMPGGTIVMTDELVRLFADDEAVLVGVFAHELGHLRHRHGMRSLVQASALGVAASLVFGDFSTVLATAPALLGQLGYSRDFEREADDESIRVMQAASIDPAHMARFFEVIAETAKNREDADTGVPGIALSSHPATDERAERFRHAGREMPAEPAR